jgi:thiamine-monophosphate kinase
VTHAPVVTEVVITGQDSKTLAAVGEFGLIKALAAWLPPSGRTLVGIGDDAAVLAVPDGRVVATTDFLLEGRHFRLDWASAADVGHKAAARSLADLAAMGAEPSALLVALAAPADLTLDWARELAAGLADECARAGASVIGGDTARADAVLLAVTGLGDLAGRAPVRRSGAAPGDLVAVAGPLGHAAAGLALLSAGVAAPGPAPDPLVAPLIAGHLRPAPPYDAGPEAADLGATAMIDISDGLLADLGHVAAASGVRIDLDSAALRPAEDLLTAARAVAGEDRHGSGRTDPVSRPADALALEWVLTGGEDHSLAATFPPGLVLPPRWRVIGTVRQGNGAVVDGQPWAGAPGWDHFAELARRRTTAFSPGGTHPPGPPWVTPPGARGSPAPYPGRASLRSARDLARLDAGRAHVYLLGRAADGDTAALDVRVPAAGGAAVRERDVLAEARPLAAYVADGSHSSLHY